MKNEVGFSIPVRPYPPEWIFDEDTSDFVPARNVFTWIKATFLNHESEMFNLDHKHLSVFYWPNIAVLWARGGYIKQGRRVAGTAEKVMFNAGGWVRERQENQLKMWFGHVPDYLITIDASYAKYCSDIDFCALIEHELYHIAHKRNAFGFPDYNKKTGLPKLEIRGHDIEEFTGVVRRYGASGELLKMIEAAKQRPELSKAAIHHACGTCLLKVV